MPVAASQGRLHSALPRHELADQVRVTSRPHSLAGMCVTKHTSLRGRLLKRPVSKGFVQNPCRETGPC